MPFPGFASSPFPPTLFTFTMEILAFGGSLKYASISFLTLHPSPPSVFYLSLPMAVFFFFFSFLLLPSLNHPLYFLTCLFFLFLYFLPSHSSFTIHPPFLSAYPVTHPCLPLPPTSVALLIVHPRLLLLRGLLILNAYRLSAAGQMAAALWWHRGVTKLNWADKKRSGCRSWIWNRPPQTPPSPMWHADMAL